MPITAKLSRRFYERFGDEITNELVDWLNSVDATYQASLRELNEINFARFDAKLEQRIAGVESRIGQRIAESESRMIRWMVTLWTGSILSTLGVIVALVLRR
jgi:hypothetical protein